MLRLVTPPADLPVTVAEMKAHARIDASDEDAVLATYIGAAVAELAAPYGWLGRSLEPQTLEWVIPAPTASSTGRVSLELPGGPVIAVTSVTYRADDTTTQTAAPSEYRLIGDVLMFPGGLPALVDAPDALTIRYQAGFPRVGGVSGVPQPARVAIMGLAADLFERREAATERPAQMLQAYQQLAATLRTWTGF